MTDEQKIAIFDALIAHLETTLDGYYNVSSNPPVDPNYDSGAVPSKTTRITELSLDNGWLAVEIEIVGRVDRHAFLVELPTLTRDNEV